MIVDFLMEEVVSRQPPQIRDFLATTALLEKFCVPLCDFILHGSSGEADSRKLISQISNFVVGSSRVSLYDFGDGSVYKKSFSDESRELG